MQIIKLNNISVRIKFLRCVRDFFLNKKRMHSFIVLSLNEENQIKIRSYGDPVALLGATDFLKRHLIKEYEGEI
jgi:hypothetical protein